MTRIPRKKVLVVDDSSTALIMSMTILAREPYLLVAAHDGDEAIDKARIEKPDLILMDTVMPRMGGVEACRMLRLYEETRSIPVLLVATIGEEEHIKKGLAAGCADCVMRPLNGELLLAKVREHLSVERPSTEAPGDAPSIWP